MKDKIFLIFLLVFISCSKNENVKPANPGTFTFQSVAVNGIIRGFVFFNVKTPPVIKFSFAGGAINQSTVGGSITMKDGAGTSITQLNYSYDNDSSITITPASLKPITSYILRIDSSLKTTKGASLSEPLTVTFVTAIDSTDKFPQLTDSALLTLIEQQTFKYFYDFGHPVSGLARERNSSGDVVTTGGSGFGIMAMIVGVQRNFISRAQALSRIDTIVSFLTNKAQRYHGAFPHWMNGGTGVTVPFSQNDNGADLVETSYMMQGLLTARQFFNTSDPTEIALRAAINNLWNSVEWNWFRQAGQNVLYWHWSPTLGFIINQPINGWDEAMIVYALAASSPVDSNRIPKIVYDNGWAMNGAIKNGSTYYGFTLPLGPPYGGPLFFAHYSFLGVNPANLTDTYADYWMQNQNHSLINYTYCVNNNGNYNGYSSSVWGLTASDDNISGYAAHSPTNDDGVISPTAAISSLPYTPTQSMDAIHFFYYKLGDKIWGNYGFVDAFNLTNVWFANSYLAIDQGPEIIMIENYRSGLLWNLFMSSPEIKTGMKSLGFQSPNLN